MSAWIFVLALFVPQVLSSGQGAVLTLVNGEGEAESGVRVWYLSGGSDRDWEQTDFPGDLEHLLERFCPELVSDAAGRVIVPAEAGSSMVGARKGDLWGFGRVAAFHAEPARIEMKPFPRTSVMIEVVDAAGRPQRGVPVGAVRWYRDRGGRSGEFSAPLVRPVPVDADGKLVLMLGGPTDVFGAGGRFEPRAAEAYLPFPIRPSRRAKIEGEELRFVLPPVGRILVRFEETGGGLLDWDGELSLRDLSMSAPSAHRPESLEVDVENGTAEIPFVGTDLEIQVLATVRDSWVEPTLQKLRGPRSAGEEVVWRIVPLAGATIVHGRVLDENGAPVADSELICKRVPRSDPPEAHAYRTVETDARGRFRLAVPSAGDSDWIVRGSFASPLADRGSRNQIGALPPGERDLGDLTLGEVPIVTSGVLLDERGQPVAGATVQLSPAPALPPALARPGSVRFSAKTDPSGTFTIHDWDTTSAWYALVYGQGIVSMQDVRLEAGRSDVVVRATRTGELAGRMLLDEGIPARCISVALFPEDADLARTGRGLSDGSFSVPGIPPGHYDVELRTFGRAVLHRVEGLEVQSGETTRDPRLAGVDLRGQLLAIQAEFRAAGEHWVEGGQVDCRRPGAKTWDSIVAFPHDEIEFVLARGAWVFRYRVKGFRTIVSDDLSRRQSFELESYIEVRLRFIEPLPRGLLPYTIRPRLDPEEPGILGWRDRSDEAVFDADGEMVVRLQAPGRYRLSLDFTQIKGSVTATRQLDSPFPVWVEVADQDGEQVLDLKLPPEVAELASKRL